MPAVRVKTVKSASRFVSGSPPLAQTGRAVDCRSTCPPFKSGRADWFSPPVYLRWFRDLRTNPFDLRRRRSTSRYVDYRAHRYFIYCLLRNLRPHFRHGIFDNMLSRLSVSRTHRGFGSEVLREFSDSRWHVLTEAPQRIRQGCTALRFLSVRGYRMQVRQSPSMVRYPESILGFSIG